MDEITRIESKVAQMLSEAEDLRDRADALEEAASELENALKVIKHYAPDIRETKLSVDSGVTDAREFRLETSPAKLTQKEMIKAVVPSTEETAIGPKELTDLINTKFSVRLKSNQIRPIIWKMATDGGEAMTKDGRYWIPQPGGEGEDYDFVDI